jgi:hypothetical protein
MGVEHSIVLVYVYVYIGVCVYVCVCVRYFSCVSMRLTGIRRDEVTK